MRLNQNAPQVREFLEKSPARPNEKPLQTHKFIRRSTSVSSFNSVDRNYISVTNLGFSPLKVVKFVTQIQFGLSRPQTSSERSASIRQKKTNHSDNASTKLLLLFATALIGTTTHTSQAHAEFKTDASIQGQARSFPVGGSLDLELGESFKLWGEKESPLLGFVRAAINSSHSGLFNSGGGSLEIFPLGFIGIKAGYEILNNENEYDSFDCSSFRCFATWERRYLEAQLALKVKSLFLISRASLSDFDPDQRNSATGVAKDPRSVIDPGMGLPLRQEGERVNALTVIAGYEWNEHWQSLALLQDYHARGADLSTQYQYLVLRWVNKGLSAQLGAGITRSDLYPVHGSVVGGLRWEILPSFKLF